MKPKLEGDHSIRVRFSLVRQRCYFKDWKLPDDGDKYTKRNFKICILGQRILRRSNLDSYDPEEGPVGDSFVPSSEALRFGETLEVPRECLIPKRDTRTTPHEVGKIFGMNPS